MNSGNGQQALSRVVILGGTGFIGGQLARHLMEKGFGVKVLGSRDADLTDPEAAARALEGCGKNTGVILSAAVTRRQRDDAGALAANIAMAAHTAAAARAQRVGGLVYLSSVDVYGRPPVDLPLTEESPVCPDTFYGLSKLTGEMICRIQGARVFPLGILRLPGVYGPGDGQTSVVGRLVGQALETNCIKISGRGNQKRDFLAVADLCSWVADWLAHPRDCLFNLVTGQSRSLADMGARVCRNLGRGELRFDPGPPTEGFDLEFEVNGLRKGGGPLPMVDVETGIAAYVRARGNTRPGKGVFGAEPDH